jgi:hypothetical protein
VLSTGFQQGQEVFVHIIPAEATGDVVTEAEGFLDFMVKFILPTPYVYDLLFQGYGFLVSFGYELIQVLHSMGQGNGNGRVCVSNEYAHGHDLLVT